MTLAVVSISILCILLIMGFRFDITDRTIEQGGLLQFRSTPAGARVILNDRQLSAVTPTKRDVAVGNHSVTMQRQGYKSWSRDVTIKAGELRWLNYARLIPEELVTRPVLELGEGLRDAKATPDRRYLAVIEVAAQPTVRIVDLSNDESLESRISDRDFCCLCTVAAKRQSIFGSIELQPMERSGTLQKSSICRFVICIFRERAEMCSMQ